MVRACRSTSHNAPDACSKGYANVVWNFGIVCPALPTLDTGTILLSMHALRGLCIRMIATSKPAEDMVEKIVRLAGFTGKASLISEMSLVTRWLRIVR